jgi:DNA-binding protein H-NS
MKMATAEQSKLEKMEAQLAALQEKRVAIEAEVRAKAIALVHSIMKDHGLTAEDLNAASAVPVRAGPKQLKGAAKKASTVAAKYQDPKTGVTWSGRGREPGWIKGKKREKFLIAE